MGVYRQNGRVTVDEVPERRARSLHALEWTARAISFVGLAGVAVQSALLTDDALVIASATFVVLVAAAYSALAFRLRAGQTATAPSGGAAIAIAALGGGIVGASLAVLARRR